MTPNPTTAAPTLSLLDRLLGVFATPGEVFEQVAQARVTPANWLVPVLLSCLVGSIAFLALAEQPAVRQQILDDKQIQALLHWNGTSADSSDANLAGALAAARLHGVLTILFSSFAGTFWSAFVVWIIGRVFLKSPFPYRKSLEVVGLAQMILVLAAITTALLVSATAQPAAKPALSLFVNEFDAQNRIHLALASVNLFYVWMAAVVAAGLAKLAGVSYAEAAFWTIGYWCALRIGLILA